MNPGELLAQLRKDSLFKQWQKQHLQAYLTHFFAQIDGEFTLLSPWEIGFFNPATNKMTIFMQENTIWIIKPEDDVFKKEADHVEELHVEAVKGGLEKVKPLFLEHLPQFFPAEVFGNGFIILQMWPKKAVWNATLITKTVKFANLKIDAETGEVSDHQMVDLVQKGDSLKER